MTGTTAKMKEKKQKLVKQPNKLSLKLVKKHIPGSYGNKSEIARRCRVSANAMYQFFKKHYDELEPLRKLEEETLIDKAEWSLKKAIDKGDSGLIKYLLSTKGKSRGYGEKIDIEMPEPIRIEFVNKTETSRSEK